MALRIWFGYKDKTNILFITMDVLNKQVNNFAWD